MKKLLSALLLLGLLTLSACSNKAAPQETPSPSLLEKIQSQGYMTIATEGTWQPWTYHNEEGELVGFDVELAKAIAEKLGVEAQFVEGNWDGLLAGTGEGRYDMLANGVDITEDRQKSYAFSSPYAYNYMVVIVKNDDDSIRSMEDLNGKTTANTITSTYAQVAEEFGAVVSPVDDLNQTFLLLQQGRIDATLNSELTFYDYLKEQPDAAIRIAVTYNQATEVGLAMPKENSDSYVEAVNQALEQLREDGTLSALSEKYFGRDITNKQ